MSATELSGSIVLGKRKRVQRAPELVLHLSGGSRSSSPAFTTSEHEAGESDHVSGIGSSSKSRGPIIVNGKLVCGDQKRYRCIFAGCNKAYKKPSRLQEHERSHTGERPFVCSTCSKSYLRESHLQAHVRTHMPASARPLVCQVDGCEKRFWTNQHLKFHEKLHFDEKPFKCTHAECERSYSKQSQLRAHIASVHCPPGTKSFRCEHSNCEKSFATSQKLRAHVKTHDEKRYTCVHPSCTQTTELMYFGTWSALQSHNRKAHPATCPYAACSGRTFSAQKGLRAHLKIHEQREIEDALLLRGDGEDCEDGDDVGRERKRRRGGEVGRDWMCDVAGCEKDFKSNKALMTHQKVTHLQRRDFVCTHIGEDGACGLAFGYKHLLQRHVAKMHAHQSTDDDPAAIVGGVEEGHQYSAIDVLTGKAYADRASATVATGRSVRCPFPDLSAPLVSTGRMHGHETEATEGGARERTCEYAFTRAYDFRRHLAAAHNVDVGKEDVEKWVLGRK
ncbi:hypothetical protein BD410DRAFT_531543 [Rickenella mellea]|uniref:C2H2-type domain-containing protein n=1 Tax=Rickenella mellea TaxID=50990 RepID=A0A4Y7QGZ5_9AGAM|nr:hypothetical protein BD410DRAFT_531543 [Rickenella mellea]